MWRCRVRFERYPHVVEVGLVDLDKKEAEEVQVQTNDGWGS